MIVHIRVVLTLRALPLSPCVQLLAESPFLSDKASIATG
jgi:hypothetical protein